MARKLSASSASFHAAQGFAVLGLTGGVLLWFTGFIAIGGEWFLMWQSDQWNETPTSFRFAAAFLLILVCIQLPEPSNRRT